MADTASSSGEDNSFDVTIDDTSPTIVYSPSDDGLDASSAADGWVSCFASASTSLCNPAGESTETNATTLHFTTTDGASLTLDWNGTAVSLYGLFPVNNPSFPSTLSYSISLDGVPTTNYNSSSTSGNASQDVLASFTNLTNDKHHLQLTMHNPDGLSGPTAQLLFDRAVITSTVPSQYTLQPNATLTTQVFPDAAISFHGEWSFDQDLLPDQDLAFHTSTNVGDSATLEFNGTAIALFGLTTPLSGAYNATLDDETPQTLSARSSLNTSTILFLRTGLDPSVAHQLTIINVGSSAGEGSLLAVGSVDVTHVMQDSGGATAAMSSSLSHGAIAGIAVGAAAVVTILLMAVILLVYRRRRTARRKQDLIVNPRLSFFRRLSLRPSARHSQHVEEKVPESEIHDAQYPNAVFNIGGRKEEDWEDVTEDHGRVQEDLPQPAMGSRHASQNSDGSYAISLPELPQKTHSRSGSGEITPPLVRPIASVVSRMSPRSQQSPVPPMPSPRSPKPRGPRDMNPSPSLPHGRSESQGILLKEMYTPTADVPTDVQEDADLPATNDPSLLSAAPASPLRVNFEEELAAHSDRKRESRFRSGISGFSIPQSLRQALSWGSDPNRQSISQVTLPDTTAPRPRENRFSFLDMESTRSNSVSGGTPSTRPSRTTSTRSSSKSQRNADDSEWSAPGKAGVPPLPQRSSMGVSMVMAGGPTPSQPSLSPNISLQAVPLPHVTISDDSNPQSPQDIPQSAHPHELSEYLPSPTESIPMTLSDIHFRHSSQSSTSVSVAPRPSEDESIQETERAHVRASASTAEPTARESQGSRPYIVQKLLGRHGADSGPSTPFSSPTARTFRPSGPRTSVRRSKDWVGPSFSSAMSKPRPS